MANKRVIQKEDLCIIQTACSRGNIMPCFLLKSGTTIGTNHLSKRSRYIKQSGFNLMRKIKRMIKSKKGSMDTLIAYGMILARKGRS